MSTECTAFNAVMFLIRNFSYQSADGSGVVRDFDEKTQWR